ncbi:amidase [Mangrovicoccus sp. HB161399]|uniref:amidase n=1 Tax=Mangrovicoccus sp. HB161399 TaxID=2720392 RepID=UPI001557F433|nr:amidase [Mangrovicoccus sp. HB161399]
MDISRLSLCDLAEHLRSRTLRSADVTQLMLDRIAASGLGAFIAVLPETAMDAARAADRALDAAAESGTALPRLTGVPVALKDIYDLEGVATTGGMGFRHDAIATRDATATARLKAAGAVILGKTALTEGVHAEHTHFPAPANPWNAARWCGASSSGSGVAVAAGLCYMGLASETGGSIRIPAAMNGVTGLKPTWGRVSRAGAFELAATLDHVGPLARSAADAAETLWTLAGPDPRDPTATHRRLPPLAEIPGDVKGLRIGVDLAANSAGTDPEHVAAHEAMLEVLAAAGAEIVAVRTPDPSEMIWDWFAICATQTALAHRDTYPARRDEYGPALAELIEKGRSLAGMELQDVIRRRREFRGAFEALFGSVDLVATPAMAFSAPRTEDMARASDEIITGLHRFTCPYTMSGHPALSMPAGIHGDGMPINAQLLGPLMGEAALVRAGMAFQAATAHHLRHP